MHIIIHMHTHRCGNITPSACSSYAHAHAFMCGYSPIRRQSRVRMWGCSPWCMHIICTRTHMLYVGISSQAHAHHMQPHLAHGEGRQRRVRGVDQHQQLCPSPFQESRRQDQTYRSSRLAQAGSPLLPQRAPANPAGSCAGVECPSPLARFSPVIPPLPRRLR